MLEITWTHDHELDVEELNEEVELIRLVEVETTWKEILSNIGVNSIYAKVYKEDGSFEYTDFFRYSGKQVKLEENGDRAFKFSEVTKIEGTTDYKIGKVRYGKFSKAITGLGFSSEQTKEVMTEYNAKFRRYGLFKTNNFYQHYRRMHRDGVCQSCMSRTNTSYDISIDGYDYSPLISYEVDPLWSLYLLRDMTKHEINPNEYSFVARAVVEDGEVYGSTYGSRYAMRQALEAVDIADSYPCGTLVALETDSGDIVLPYIDGASEVGHDYNEFDLEGSGAEPNDSTGLMKSGWFCEYCEENHSDDETYYYFDGQYCEEAIGNVFHILHNGDLCDVDSCTYVESQGGYYECDEVVLTEDTEEYILLDDAIYCETNDCYYETDDDLCIIDYAYYLKEDTIITEDTGEYYLEDSDDYFTHDGLHYEHEHSYLFAIKQDKED